MSSANVPSDMGGTNVRWNVKLFVSLNFREKQVENLKKMQNNFDSFLLTGKKVAVENLSCTLTYLGEVSAELLPSVCDKLNMISKMHKSFNTSFHDTGHFGNGCVAVKLKAATEFVNLQKHIEVELAEFVKKPLGKYLPHVVLFRDAKLNMHFREVKKSVPVFNVPFAVTEFSLLEVTSSADSFACNPLTYFQVT